MSFEVANAKFILQVKQRWEQWLGLNLAQVNVQKNQKGWDTQKGRIQGGRSW